MKGPAAIALTALLSSTVIFPASASELAQPSPINNVLYLHYNMTYHQGWMNVNISDDGDDGWSYYGGIFGFTEPIYLRFIMKPGLNGSVCLITDPARNWTVHVGHYEGSGMSRGRSWSETIIARLRRRAGIPLISHSFPELPRSRPAPR
jgi:hypothetical protein